MRRRLTLGLFIVISSVTLGTARAQDVSNGKRIAQSICGDCHLVDPAAQKADSGAVPTFLSIAQMPSTTERSLAAFLSTSHRGMPNFILTRPDIQDISAYILSLRTPQ